MVIYLEVAVVPGREAEAVQGDSSSPEGEGHIPAVVEGDVRSLEGEELRKIQREGGHHREHTAGSSLEGEREISKWPFSPKCITITKL